MFSSHTYLKPITPPLGFGRLLLAALVALAAALPLAQAAAASPPGPVVPTRIRVEAGNKVFLVGHARRRPDLRVQRDRGWLQLGARGPPSGAV